LKKLLYVQGGYPTINDNTISANSANSWGGGMYLCGVGGSINEPTVTRNLIKDNAAETTGAESVSISIVHLL
jgi:hypothetical protein